MYNTCIVIFKCWTVSFSLKLATSFYCDCKGSNFNWLRAFHCCFPVLILFFSFFFLRALSLSRIYSITHSAKMGWIRRSLNSIREAISRSRRRRNRRRNNQQAVILLEVNLLTDNQQADNQQAVNLLADNQQADNLLAANLLANNQQAVNQQAINLQAGNQVSLS